MVGGIMYIVFRKRSTEKNHFFSIVKQIGVLRGGSLSKDYRARLLILKITGEDFLQNEVCLSHASG